MAEIRETIWEYVAGETTGTFYTGQKKWLNKINNWNKQYPDEIQIQHVNKDGSMVVRLPATWFRIAPKNPRNISQEHRDALRDRMANLRQKAQ